MQKPSQFAREIQTPSYRYPLPSVRSQQRKLHWRSESQAKVRLLLKKTTKVDQKIDKTTHSIVMSRFPANNVLSQNNRIGIEIQDLGFRTFLNLYRLLQVCDVACFMLEVITNTLPKNNGINIT